MNFQVYSKLRLVRQYTEVLITLLVDIKVKETEPRKDYIEKTI